VVRRNVDRNYNRLTAEESRPVALVVVSPVETVPTKLLRDPLTGVPGAAVLRSTGKRTIDLPGRALRLRIRAPVRVARAQRDRSAPSRRG